MTLRQLGRYLVRRNFTYSFPVHHCIHQYLAPSSLYEAILLEYAKQDLLIDQAYVFSWLAKVLDQAHAGSSPRSASEIWASPTITTKSREDSLQATYATIA